MKLKILKWLSNRNLKKRAKLLDKYRELHLKIYTLEKK